MPGMMKKGMMYREGGPVKAPARRQGTERPAPRPQPRRGRSFEEDMTPPPGMRGFDPQMVPTDEPPPGRPSRMKKGGMVKKKAGGMIGKPKAKGK